MALTGTILKIEDNTRGLYHISTDTVDNVFVFTDADGNIVKIIDSKGPYIARLGGVLPGSDMTSKLNTIFAHSDVHEVVIDSGAITISGTLTISSGKSLILKNSASLVGSGTISGGKISAPLESNCISTSLALTGVTVDNGVASVNWFGATGNGGTDDYTSIQRAIDICISNGITKLYFTPGKTYKTDSPLICAKVNVGAGIFDYFSLTLISNDTGNNFFFGTGATIHYTFKNAPGISFHLAKSGGITGININGPYSLPSYTNAQYYTLPYASYGDGTMRDSQYSPSCGIVVDPFQFNSLPPDGGYPTLTAWYSKAPSQPSLTSGSTGLKFYDLRFANNHICSAHSVNGQTNNCENMLYSQIYVESCKLGFASTQTQEKSNIYDRISFWGYTHTLFDNTTYGLQQGGHFSVSNCQSAGIVARAFNINTGGWFFSNITNMYAESIGSLGSIYSSQATTITDSVFDFATYNVMGGVMPDFHIDLQGAVHATRSTFRMYGSNLGVVINGSGFFDDCTFEEVPSIFPIRVQTGMGYPVFRNSKLNSAGDFFSTVGALKGQYNQLNRVYIYGNYTIEESQNEQYGINSKVEVNGDKIYHDQVYDTNIAITVSSAAYSFTSSYAAFYKVGEPVFLIKQSDGTINFSGYVLSIVSTTITVSQVPLSIVNSTYHVIVQAKYNLYHFIGDFTSGSYDITNCKSSIKLPTVGQWLYHPWLYGWARVTAVVGTTITTTNGCQVTTNGVSMKSENTRFVMHNQYTGAFTVNYQNYPVCVGDRIIENVNGGAGYQRRYRVTRAGLINPTVDTRVAEWTEENDIVHYASTTEANLYDVRQYYDTTDKVFKFKQDSTWSTLSGTSPGGSDTYMQFNDAGSFGGDADLVYDKTNNRITGKNTKMLHYEADGSACSRSFGAAAGTGPSGAGAILDAAGNYSITTGTGATTGTLIDFTFNVAMASSPIAVILTAADANGRTLIANCHASVVDNTKWRITADVALTDATTYSFSYVVIGQ